jgi:hypothetical protein
MTVIQQQIVSNLNRKAIIIALPTLSPLDGLGSDTTTINENGSRNSGLGGTIDQGKVQTKYPMFQFSNFWNGHLLMNSILWLAPSFSQPILKESVRCTLTKTVIEISLLTFTLILGIKQGEHCGLHA